MPLPLSLLFLNPNFSSNFVKKGLFLWATICSIANPAVGVRPFSFADMQASVQRIAAQAVPIVLSAIARIPSEAMGPEPISTGENYKGSYTNPKASSNKIIDGRDSGR